MTALAGVDNVTAEEFGRRVQIDRVQTVRNRVPRR